ncbi:kinase-like protein [Lepidopterella palustris CBS 459.81]|uniref:Kinase-like protein n=1 Tax=Lepidopterella palustris CBS 459.81 TaxID=1314670 RepID=A0A8E2J989_9PEZI|nr:kinase-like protein [Lepidopterella palustris CBS 459.81]
MISSPFGLGQLLKGKLSMYTLTKQLHQSIWLVIEETVVIKSVRHFRLENKRDVLKRFQARAPSLRPLVDKIEDPSNPPALILKYLDNDVLHALTAKKLTCPEVKYVIRNVLEALKVIHKDSYIYTDIKPDNVLVNYRRGGTRIANVKLADYGSAVHNNSKYVKEGYLIKAPIFRSPKAQLRPFPLLYREIADEDTLTLFVYTIRGVPYKIIKPFQYITEREITKEDKVFVLKIIKLNPRDRPTAKKLLQDKWFKE